MVAIIYTRLLAILALLLSTAWCDFTFSTSLCTTGYGTTSIRAVPRTTYSTTIRTTQVIGGTITPTTTLQIPRKTVVAITAVVVTQTTTLPNTKISTLTSTVTSQPTVAVTTFITVTADDPSTVAVTITAAQSTTTVPASPGFIPASSGPDLRKRQPPARANTLAGNRPGLGSRARPNYFPASVRCGVAVVIKTTETRTVTASRTVSVTSQSTTTRVIPLTVGTVTTTICPAGASTTTTVTTTLPPITNTIPRLTTTTVTATQTFTVQEPEATYYAACSPDNLLTNNPNEGGNITRVNPYVSGQWADTITATSAYDCCAQCLTYEDVLRAATPEGFEPFIFQCSGGIFLNPGPPSLGPGSANCLLANPWKIGQCDPTEALVSVNGDPDAEVPLFTAFSGPCGRVIGARFDPNFNDDSIPFRDSK